MISKAILTASGLRALQTNSSKHKAIEFLKDGSILISNRNGSNLKESIFNNSSNSNEQERAYILQVYMVFDRFWSDGYNVT